MKYPKIGEQFKCQLTGELLECIEGDHCIDCVYLPLPKCNILDIECLKHRRPTKDNVVFVKVANKKQGFGLR